MQQQPPNQPQQPISPYTGEPYNPQWGARTRPPYGPPPKKQRRTWLWVILGSIVVLSVIGSRLGTNTSQTSSTPQATSVPTQAVIVTSTPTQAPKSIDQQINTIVQNAGLTGTSIKSFYNVGGDNYEKITEDIGDGNLTNSLTVGQIQLDCFNAQQALWTKMSSHLSEVEMVVTMNVIDQYGKQSNQMVGDCDLKSGTAAKFVWANLTSESAWKDYDSTFIAPFLTQ